ncbi:MAG: hypothetical protein IKE10_01050 [Bacilli bacterium]|nr:hypothetical protein [Bacilli bacterium]
MAISENSSKDLLEKEIEGKVFIDYIVDDVLLAYYRDILQPEGIEDYTLFLDYKKSQVHKLTEGKDKLLLKDIMRYFSCPLDVESEEDITNFGLYVPDSHPTNGRLNMILSEQLLNAALDYDPKDTDEEVTLINVNDIIGHNASGLLENVSLLFHLFITGRGKEFTQLFGDTALLIKMEGASDNGRSDIRLVESDFKKKEYKSPKEEFDSDFKRLYAEDLKLINEKLKVKLVPKTNIMVKGA